MTELPDSVELNTLAVRFRTVRQVAVVGALVVAVAVAGLWMDQEGTLSSGATTEEECRMGDQDTAEAIKAAVEDNDPVAFLRVQADDEAVGAVDDCDPEAEP